MLFGWWPVNGTYQYNKRCDRRYWLSTLQTQTGKRLKSEPKLIGPIGKLTILAVRERERERIGQCSEAEHGGLGFTRSTQAVQFINTWIRQQQI